MDNLELWHKVEKTDPAHTKPITGKAYKGTSPKPYWLVQKATETFGPCGIGWGYEIVSERIERGVGEFDSVHVARVRVWYEWSGKRGVVEHVGQTMFTGKNKNGPYTDEDAPKKSVTDALVKALSMIGFAGDIFMGRYDDSKYVAELNEEKKAASRAETDPTAGGNGASNDDGPNEAEQAALRLIDEWRKKIAATRDPGELRDWWGSEARKKMVKDFELTEDEVAAVRTELVKRVRDLEKAPEGKAAA